MFPNSLNLKRPAGPLALRVRRSKACSDQSAGPYSRKHRGIFPGFPVLLALLTLPFAGANAVEVIDDTGARVTLGAPAQRIVSLAPHATELLFAAGAGDAVVGVAEFSNYPDEVTGLAVIGNSSRLNIETIVALRPDLVIAWKSGNTGGQVEQLVRLGLPVFFSEPRILADIPANLERLGRLAGTEATARGAAERFREDLADLQQTYAERTPVKVFYEIWPQPLMTVNGEHLISQIITLCSGINIFHDLPSLAPTVNFESVLQANPDVIINASSAKPRSDWYRKWLQWPELNVVKNRQFYSIDPDTIQRQTPRILEGARKMCAFLEKNRQTDLTIAPP